MKDKVEAYPIWVMELALEEYMLLGEEDRDADNIRLKLAIESNNQIQIPAETIQSWIDNGLQVPSRPDWDQPWAELKVKFDKGTWDPALGYEEKGLRGKRNADTKQRLEKLTNKVVRSSRFKEKAMDSPSLLNSFNQRYDVGDVAEEGLSEEDLIEMINRMVAKDTEAFLDLLGASARRKLREAVNKYKG